MDLHYDYVSTSGGNISLNGKQGQHIPDTHAIFENVLDLTFTLENGMTSILAEMRAW